MTRQILAFLIVSMMAAPAFAAGAWIGLVLDRAGGGGSAQVREVVDGSPGQRAGIAPGEQILSIDEQATEAPEILIAAVRRAGVGATVKLKVRAADGKERTVTVKLEAKPQESDLQRGALVGQPAPDFEPSVQAGPKLAGKLSSLRGKVVLLDFFATWCGPCREAMPHLEHLHETYGSKGLKVIGISSESKKVVAAAAQRFNLKYTLAADEGESVTGRYRVFALPTMVLIDKKGIVRDVAIADAEAMDAAIQSALKAD
jgi:peroxiredoxin